jgi:hypothetical protein
MRLIVDCYVNFNKFSEFETICCMCCVLQQAEILFELCKEFDKVVVYLQCSVFVRCHSNNL